MLQSIHPLRKSAARPPLSPGFEAGAANFSSLPLALERRNVPVDVGGEDAGSGRCGTLAERQARLTLGDLAARLGSVRLLDNVPVIK